MSKDIFTIRYVHEDEKNVQIDYIPGSQEILVSSLVAASLKNQEIREALFNATANCIALADNPQEWLNAVINGVNFAKGKVKIESDNTNLS